MAGITTDAAAPRVAAPAFAPGMVIAGRYRLESRLGSGGGGTVWRCFDEKLGAIVAFKIVSADVDVERWRREVAMARRIADRNVCRVHDLGETSDVRFVTMELVEGTSLRSKIDPALPERDARELFRQIVSGTAAIHAAGVVHRDLKPENIVVDNTGRVVIVDFGLAREPRGGATPQSQHHMIPDDAANATVDIRGSSAAPREAKPHELSATVTHAGVIVGTPRYMSPEQAAGDTVDARTDVWALGLIGYELLTGVLPPLDQAGGRRVGDVAKWPAVQPVLQRCTSLLPRERYANARELLAALSHRPRGRARIAIAVVAAVAATGIIAVVREMTRDDKQGPTPVNPPPTKPTPIDGVRVLQVTNTTDKQWPRETPQSIALSPDATELAYTTANGELRVRSFAGGAETKWVLPGVESASALDPAKTYRSPILTSPHVVGWYSDRSLAVLGMARENLDGEWRLYRVRSDGTFDLIHHATHRFPVAVSGDVTVTAKESQGLFFVLPSKQIDRIGAVIGNGERVTAIAISPSGRSVASVRVSTTAKREVTIHITPTDQGAGASSTVVARGGPGTGEFLAWLDDNRLAFVGRSPGKATKPLLVYDVRSQTTETRYEWNDDHVGVGSAAAGIAVVLHGSARDSVRIADKKGYPQEPLHDVRAARSHMLAGWTSDGRVVFAMGEPGEEALVRGSVANGIENWPNTTPGVEIPDAVVDTSVIAHHRDGEQIVVERIDADGKHTELQRVPASPLETYVRCAGEISAPCVLARLDGERVSWTELDPHNRALGKTLFARDLHEALPSAALSKDGKILAIVEGTDEVHLVTDSKLRTIRVRDAEALESISFAENHDAWVSARGLGQKLFATGRYVWDSRDNDISKSTTDRTVDRYAMMRSFDRPTASPDMEHIAVVVREYRLEISRIDGL